MARSKTATVDMSPEAVAQRLREVSQLRKLGLRLRQVRWLGRREQRREDVERRKK